MDQQCCSGLPSAMIRRIKGGPGLVGDGVRRLGLLYREVAQNPAVSRDFDFRGAVDQARSGHFGGDPLDPIPAGQPDCAQMAHVACPSLVAHSVPAKPKDPLKDPMMSPVCLSRRRLLLAGASLAGLAAGPAVAATGRDAVHVRKDPDCGCCADWIAILEADGFSVTVEMVAPDELARFKLAQGIPETMVSCHTAEAAGYLIEGHVPPADLRRLLEDRPDAIGLAVPGMPWGSPGMGPETEREAYDVFLIARDGSTTVFASYPSA
jgi:hypothetical protein